jgi:hypothetical protein
MAFERRRAAEEAAHAGEKAVEAVRHVLDELGREALDAECVRMIAERSKHHPIVLEKCERMNHFTKGNEGSEEDARVCA